MSGSTSGSRSAREFPFEATIRRREDEARIRELACLYARMVDRRDWDSIADVFADDAQLSGPGFSMRGHRELIRGLSGIDRYAATLHCVHNQLIEISGDDASGEVYCVANHLHKIEGEPWKLDMGIRYQDRYRRTGAGWRIVTRTLDIVWQQEARLC
ncbi:MAG TPA: nuclear transport factor 2 family protein [Deltaproteobacteria bacterium]|nr:nuclear transport factor 2 family protein [Deltaproteobacteria bacterium]